VNSDSDARGTPRYKMDAYRVSLSECRKCTRFKREESGIIICNMFDSVNAALIVSPWEGRGIPSVRCPQKKEAVNEEKARENLVYPRKTQIKRRR
jgi:hypothetical protein